MVNGVWARDNQVETRCVACADPGQRIAPRLPRSPVSTGYRITGRAHIVWFGRGTNAAHQAGAAGYLLKDSADAELVQAVVAVSQGKSFFSLVIASAMLDGYDRDDTGQ